MKLELIHELTDSNNHACDVLLQLMQEFEGLKTSQLKHVRKISYLEQELVRYFIAL